MSTRSAAPTSRVGEGRSEGSNRQRGDTSSAMLRWASIATIGFVLLLIYLALMGGKEELATQYGKRRGAGAAESVNGTAVLATMFEKAGHRVATFTELNRRLDSYDTIVWAPDDFGPPSLEARQFVESWLGIAPYRTFIYIGRDYDAAPEYWQRMLAQVDDPRHDEYQRRLAHSQSEFAARRAEFPDHEFCGWFTMTTDPPTRKIPDLDGPWAEGIDASKTNIVLAGRLDVPDRRDLASGYVSDSTEIEILLQSENDILAHSFQHNWWSSSRVIVVANGSFTLNVPLVNREHRKLAAKLIAECGDGKDVAFLESGPRGVEVSQVGRSPARTHALHLFTIWPVSFIFIHFAALGIAYCIATFPIFGRPHHLPSEARSDFGKHVAALGELLQKTKDTFFAESRIRGYQTHAKRGSGQLHRLPTASPSPLVGREEMPGSPITATVVESTPNAGTSSQQPAKAADASQPKP